MLALAGMTKYHKGPQRWSYVYLKGPNHGGSIFREKTLMY